MKRREFISVVAGAVAWPKIAQAQQSVRPWRLGFIAGGVRPVPLEGTLYDAFPQGMRALGYVQGKDFTIEWRFAEGKYERFHGFAQELVDLNVDVIVLGAMAAVRPTQEVTSTIPIVMGHSVDPVGNGLIASLAHPGGNTTGVSGAYEEIVPKILEMMGMIVPKLSIVAMFTNPNNHNHSANFKFTQTPATKLGITILPVQVGAPEHIEPAFDAMKQGHAEAVIIPSDALYLSQRKQLAELAKRDRLPTVFAQREYVLAGGLMSYGENLADFYRRAASFVDKILKGAKPSDLPVQLPTKFNLVFNLKTADEVGVIVPDILLARADELV